MPRLIAAVLALVLLAQPAAAEQRLALVIGNDAYAEVVPLQKAVNDARAMAAALAAMGFEVITAENAGRREMNFTVQTFVNRIGAGDVVAVFYAGHGVEIAGENFLLPVDIPRAEPGQEGYVKAEAVSLNAVLDMLRARKARLNIVVLDACRNNPFAAGGARAVGAARGLARISAPEGTFVMYSADVGEAALDRLRDADRNPNSVFTRTLIPLMRVPGHDLVDLAREVRRRVHALAESVAHQQTPAYYDAVLGTFSFVEGPTPPPAPPAAAVIAAAPPPAVIAAPAQTAPAPAVPTQAVPTQAVPTQGAQPPAVAPAGQSVAAVAPPAPASVPAETIRNDFDLARTIGTAEAWRAFLARHGYAETSFYVQLAQAALAKLESAPAMAAPPAIATSDSKAAEQAAFEEAQRIGSVEAWEAFLDRYDTGAGSLYVDLAYAALDRLEPAAPANPAPLPSAEDQLAWVQRLMGQATGGAYGGYGAYGAMQPGLPAASFAALTSYELQDFDVVAQRSLHAGAPHGPTPTAIPGGRVVTTFELIEMARRGEHFLLLDALGGAQRLPDALPAAEAGQAGSFEDAVQDQLSGYLWQATGGNYDTALVFYCGGMQCWLSYNAALRAIELGYRNVLWYRGGIEAWQSAGGYLMPW